MEKPEQLSIPAHVAIIMDGNGRWARARGLARPEGHAEGAVAVRTTVEAARSLGIRYLTLYAFSVANWLRPDAEVHALMRLLAEFAESEKEDLRANGIRVAVVGELDELPTGTRRAVDEVIRHCAGGQEMTLSLALSYGGRQDIVNAARALAVQARAGLVLPEEVDARFFHRQMSTSQLPDVDLLIRTGGESRLSDFLLFEAAYAELVFLPLMWPEFTEAVLNDCVREYSRRQRRFGLTGEQLEHVTPAGGGGTTAA